MYCNEHWCKDSRNTPKRAKKDIPVVKQKYRKQKWKENECMDSSREKLRRLHTRWLKRENLKKETESISMPVPNNAIQTKYIKATHANKRQYSNHRLSRNRDETVMWWPMKRLWGDRWNDYVVTDETVMWWQMKRLIWWQMKLLCGDRWNCYALTDETVMWWELKRLYGDR